MDIKSADNVPLCIIDEDGTKDGISKLIVESVSVATVFRVTAEATRLVVGEIDLSNKWYGMLFNFEGSIVFSGDTGSSVRLVPPRTLVAFRPDHLRFFYGRGFHEYTFIEWHEDQAPELVDWMHSRPQVTGDRSMYSQPMDPTFSNCRAHLDEVLSNSLTANPRLLGILYETLPLMMTTKDGTNLAPLPPELPDTIANLARRVRKSPTSAWPLKEAADFAGYSPFHFSRVFKSLVGYGFHEFVERCRTEVALNSLLTSDASIDSVASQAGFGTTQGLREAMKEYLGLVPSELRSSVESR